MNAMTSRPLAATETFAGSAEFQTRLLEYAMHTGELREPEDVLGALHAITSKSRSLCVLGAARFPINDTQWDSLRLGRSVFLHADAPDGWWEEYNALARGKFRSALFLARSSLASFTWTEIQRLFEPVGVDRWAFELALKFGMRDGLTCPVGGRWVLAFWSRRVLTDILKQRDRIAIFAAASYAALRLEQLNGADPERIRPRARLTARELAVLRFVSTGMQTPKIAQSLGLSEETIRSHLKKAEAKLGVSNRAHAACEAVRQNLIP